MSNWRRSALSLAVGLAVFALFWQLLLWVAAAPASILAVVVCLASGQEARTQRFRQFALTGAVIGSVAGGVGAFAFVRITG